MIEARLLGLAAAVLLATACASATPTASGQVGVTPIADDTTGRVNVPLATVLCAKTRSRSGSSCRD